MALLFATLAAFSAGAVTGGVVVYWTMSLVAQRRTGKTVTERTKEQSKVWVIVLVLSTLLVTFGLQVRDSNQRDSDYRAQQKAFRHQQECLTHFSLDVSQYLVNTLNRRVKANDRLARANKALTVAQLAKDAANDRVVEVVAGAFVDNPPTTTDDDFTVALEKFRAAKAHLVKATVRYAKVERETRTTLKDTGSPSKPYDPPKVDCVP